MLSAYSTRRAGTFSLPYKPAVVDTESPAGATSLAQRLRDSGARMYGAFWCSHCNAQKREFGKDAQTDLPYIECYPDGYQGPGSIAKACKEADVEGFPTWLINGQKLEGDWSLAALQDALDGADTASIQKKYAQ